MPLFTTVTCPPPDWLTMTLSPEVERLSPGARLRVDVPEVVVEPDEPVVPERCPEVLD